MNWYFNTEKNLITACLEGNPRAQRELYDRYAQVMYNTVFRYTGDRHFAEDVLQTGFLKVFKYLRTFDPEKGNLKAWIRKIHIRCALDFLSNESISFTELQDTIIFEYDEPNALKNLEAEYILRFIMLLPERERIIFNLYEIEGYRHGEIAEMLDININSCRVYLARAKNELKNQIEAFKKKEILVVYE